MTTTIDTSADTNVLTQVFRAPFGGSPDESAIRRLFEEDPQTQSGMSQIRLPVSWPAFGDGWASLPYAQACAGGSWNQSAPAFSSQLPLDMHKAFMEIKPLQATPDHWLPDGSAYPIILDLLALINLSRESDIKGLVYFESDQDGPAGPMRSILAWGKHVDVETYWLLYRDFAHPNLVDIDYVGYGVAVHGHCMKTALLGAMFYRAFSTINYDHKKYSSISYPAKVVMLNDHKRALDLFSEAYQLCFQPAIMSPSRW